MEHLVKASESLCALAATSLDSAPNTDMQRLIERLIVPAQLVVMSALVQPAFDNGADLGRNR